MAIAGRITMAPNSAGEPDLDIPDSPLSEPVPWLPTPRETPAPAPSPGSLTGKEKRVAVASVVGGGLVTLLILMSRTGVSAVPPPRPAAAPVPATAAAVSLAAATAASPTWTDENRDTWVTRSRGAFAYEVQADKPVSVWMRTVRPALVVRCERNVLDVFVFTDSAAKIEPETLDHTVTMRFDDGEEASVRWPDADTHDALFAPDGGALARKLVAARVLRFGFTPHNAEPVTMQFAVAGLAPLLARAAKEGCKAAVQ